MHSTPTEAGVLTLRERIRLARVKRQVESGERDEMAFEQRERDWLGFMRWLREQGTCPDCPEPCECDLISPTEIAH